MGVAPRLAGAARPAPGAVAPLAGAARPAPLAARQAVPRQGPRRQHGGDGGGAACAPDGSRWRGWTAWRPSLRTHEWSRCGPYERTTPRNRPRRPHRARRLARSAWKGGEAPRAARHTRGCRARPGSRGRDRSLPSPAARMAPRARDTEAGWEGRDGAGRGRMPASPPDGAPGGRRAHRGRGLSRGPGPSSRPGRTRRGRYHLTIRPGTGPVLPSRPGRTRQRWTVPAAGLDLDPAGRSPVRKSGRSIPGRDTGLVGALVGVVLAEACPVRAARPPRPVVCCWFVAVRHTRQHSTAAVKGSRRGFQQAVALARAHSRRSDTALRAHPAVRLQGR